MEVTLIKDYKGYEKGSKITFRRSVAKKLIEQKIAIIPKAEKTG